MQEWFTPALSGSVGWGCEQGLGREEPRSPLPPLLVPPIVLEEDKVLLSHIQKQELARCWPRGFHCKLCFIFSPYLAGPHGAVAGWRGHGPGFSLQDSE